MNARQAIAAPLRSALIVRNSAEARDAGWSPERQVAELRALEARQSWLHVEVLEAVGESGSAVDARDKHGEIVRTDIRRLTELIEAGMVDVAAAADHDRWGRNDFEFERFLRWCRSKGVVLWTLSGPLDDSDYRSWKERKEESLDAEKYSRKCADKSRRGHIEAAAAGKHCKTLPYGTRPSSQINPATGRRIAGVPEPCPLRWPFLLQIFTMADRRQSEPLNCSQICAWLTAAGAPTQRAGGNGAWTPHTVYRILKNRFYLGEIYKRHRSGAPYEERYGPRELVNDNARHSCRIDPDLWAAAQPPLPLRRGRPMPPGAVLFWRQLVAPGVQMTRHGEDVGEMRFVRQPYKGREVYTRADLLRRGEKWGQRIVREGEKLMCRYPAEWLDGFLMEALLSALEDTSQLMIDVATLASAATLPPSQPPAQSCLQLLREQALSKRAALKQAKASLINMVAAGDPLHRYYAEACAALEPQVEQLERELALAENSAAERQRNAGLSGLGQAAGRGWELMPAPREEAVKLGKQLNLVRELWERGLRKELEELLAVLVPRIELQSVDVGGETRALAPIIHIHDPAELAVISPKDNLGKVALYH